MSPSPSVHRPKQNGLQLVRILAAVLVLVHHSTLVAHLRTPAYPVWQAGTYGVDLFFVLSGYVMVYSSEWLLGLPAGWRVFAERRAVRIVPLYWIGTTAFLICEVVLWLQQRGPDHLATRALCSYLFLPYSMRGEAPLLGVGWTLILEMFFYLIFAVMLLLRVNVFWSTTAVLVMCSALAFRPHPGLHAYNFYLNPILIEFVFGMTLAKVQGMRDLPLVRVFSLCLVASGLTMMLLVRNVSLATRFWKVGIPAALVVLSVLLLEPVLQDLPKWVLYLADATYAIYLVHLPLMQILEHWLRPESSFSTVTVLCTASVAIGLIAGVAVYQWIDRPILRWAKDRLRVEGKRIVQIG